MVKIVETTPLSGETLGTVLSCLRGPIGYEGKLVTALHYLALMHHV